MERLNKFCPPTHKTPSTDTTPALPVLSQTEAQVNEEEEKEEETTIVTEVVSKEFALGDWKDSNEGAKADKIDSKVDSFDIASQSLIDSIA